MTENEISKVVVDCALRVHKGIGPGLLENAWEACLAYELEKKGLKIERQRKFPLIYDSVYLDVGYRVDLLIENKVIIEIKTVDKLDDMHLAQVLTYLKLSKCKLGMLINFNVPLIKNGIRRIVHTL